MGETREPLTSLVLCFELAVPIVRFGIPLCTNANQHHVGCSKHGRVELPAMMQVGGVDQAAREWSLSARSMRTECLRSEDLTRKDNS